MNVANLYNLKLHPQVKNHDIIDEYNEKYPDSIFQTADKQFTKTH